MKIPGTLLLAAAAILATGFSPLSAANIIWGTTANYAAPGDVSTEGTLVEAVNLCGTGATVSPTVNGVTFAADTTLFSGDASINFFFGDTGDPDYNNLLNTLDYGGGTSIQIGGGSLVVGNEYLVQLWFVDERGPQDGRAMRYGDGNGNLSAGVNDQFVTGTFIADGTSQTLTVTGVGTGTPHLTAYQIRDLGVPVEGVITWDAPLDYSAPGDVRTDGYLVEAINATGASGAASPVVNGVEFVADTTLLNNDATTDFLQGDTGDVAYNQFLNSLDYGSNGTLSIGNGLLEAGKEYLVQAWYVDERSGQDARAMQFGDGAGNLSDPVNDQHVSGTFIANSGSQTFTVTGTISGPHFTGYQLRDLSSPIPTLSTSAGATVAGSFSLTIDFSEVIFGLDAGDFTVVNGAVSNVAGAGTLWTCDVTPASNGDVLVTLPADAVLDIENHGNVASNTILTTYVAPGSDQPVPTLSTTSTDVYGSYTVQVDFSEPVTGLELTDFALSGGTVSNLSGSGASYSITVNPDFGGDVTVSLPRNSVTDTDGDTLQNVESNELVNAYFVVVNVNTPADLLPYLVQDNVTATLAPGTYTIDAADVNSTFGTPRFEIWGSNSCYDFTGVTINFAADIYDDNLSMSHMQVYGNDNVLKNLTMVDLCDKYGTAGKKGGVNLIVDGRNNRVEGFHMTIRGSYPYGYGDCFGKGGSYTIKHWKHSALLVRGESNHIKNCTLMHWSYGHAIFMQAASNPIIEGCYVESEVRTTDDMLAETSGPAYDIGFQTVWGFPLPPGYTKSLAEGGIRAYNAGNTYIDGVWYSRGTSNPTILNNTIVRARTGVTLTHASGTKYVSGCTTIGTERGYAIGSGIIENCFSDVQHGPAFGVDYENDSGVTADITILPHTGPHYSGSRHVAYIIGSDHNITFRGTVQNPEQDLEVNVGGDKRIISESTATENFLADDIVINNLTGYPMFLDDNSSGNSGQSIGTFSDSGTSNSITVADWSVTDNLAFYGTATQSSNSHDTIASLATDQNTDGAFWNGSVTHTNTETQPWWKLDLEGHFDISEIRIWNRTDCCSTRLSDYDVTILDENEVVVWTNHFLLTPLPMEQMFPGTMGRYVIIQLRGTDPLSLAEVEVFGTPAASYTGLENWRYAHFGTYEDTGIAADLFDADLDGIVNLVEYATGLDPNLAQGERPVEVRWNAGGTELEVAFNRIDDSLLNYVLLGTNDLTSSVWNPVWSGTGTGDEQVTVPESAWPAGEEAYFFRLQISHSE